ncbi:hypothetical protein TspCOW1_24730 [Thiohalobacter sp. COW1]|uniref:Pyruvate/2-oxoglutarate dehydrogenase complex n=1 Tax=Thiohalobacter thiocyanaticus TaxID=585455 RepID=A0A1Z4VML0_9GAMM|nr:MULTISPECIES: DUF4465 domain-containing protein [Thiohalobacter]BAZ92672.1 pyruvate/2-oxoglutarate dehydrogenase complex [Thiohalobacter thiocyanaticus]BCO32370.1 hypothetical protein TspCOW1_24730 [Thiohalobacter sp. COW1]
MQLEQKTALTAGIMLLASGAAGAATVSGFDDLALAPESYHAGVTGALYTPNTTSFTSGPATYYNEATDWGGSTSWQGWAYSNTTDTSTPGYLNQYSAYTGGGYNSSNYGVAFTSTGAASVVSFAQPSQLTGAYFTNTTYAALSMLNGDQFAKQFGGASGDDEDWFRMTITGKDSTDAVTGTLDMYLADYRFSDNSQDYILDAWTWQDLGALGTVSSLEFTLSSSDVGDYGMNTPAYFAMDDLQVSAVPLPPALWLFASGLLLLGRRVRRAAPPA